MVKGGKYRGHRSKGLKDEVKETLLSRSHFWFPLTQVLCTYVLKISFPLIHVTYLPCYNFVLVSYIHLYEHLKSKMLPWNHMFIVFIFLSSLDKIMLFFGGSKQLYCKGNSCDITHNQSYLNMLEPRLLDAVLLFSLGSFNFHDKINTYPPLYLPPTLLSSSKLLFSNRIMCHICVCILCFSSLLAHCSLFRISLYWDI